MRERGADRLDDDIGKAATARLLDRDPLVAIVLLAELDLVLVGRFGDEDREATGPRRPREHEVEPGFLEQLALRALLERLPRLDAAAGRRPRPIALVVRA